MKKLLTTIFFLTVLCSITATAQESFFNADFSIAWKGVETWNADKGSRKVITFDNAQFPDESQLPFFRKRLAVNRNYQYNCTINNEKYGNLSSEELGVLLGTTITNQTVTPLLQTIEIRGNLYIDLLVSPFVMRDGVVQKLISFSVEIIQTPNPQRQKASTMHTYTSNSVLKSGKFVKIAIVNSGVYRLTYEDLNSMGISPANVRIFGYGGEVLTQDFSKPMLDDLPEVAIQMEKGSDGVFNSGDYILFYAKGVQKWSYDRVREMFTHTINSYSSKGYYFVTSDAGVGRKIETVSLDVPSEASIVPVEEFTDFQVHENELKSLASSGKEFYGEFFNSAKSSNFLFNFPNVMHTSTTKVRLDVAASAGAVTTFSLDLDGVQTKTLNVQKRTDGDGYEKAKAANGFFTYTPVSDNLNFKLAFNPNGSSAEAYLNYIEINAQRALVMNGTAMQFQYTGELGSNNYCQYKLSNANNNVQIWDITEAHNITRVATSSVDGKLTFVAPGAELKQYIAIDPTQGNSFSKPEVIGAVANQDLHALPQAEMTIITHPRFLAQAEELAQAHRTIDNMRVNVMTTDQVYNEFSSGTPDATAYRRAIKMFYDRAKTSSTSDDMPKYLLLFGRGSFDNRKLQTTSGDNLILTYQADNSLVETLSYVTDDYFGFLDDNEGNQIPSHGVDIGLGRFPVVTVQQAQDVVKKTIDYMSNTNSGKWKNQLCFLADDGDNALHMKQSDSIASTISRNFKSYQVSKIYLDAYNQEISASGETYPVARKQLHDLIDNGLLYLNYTGHAGPLGWTNEQVMTVNDINAMSNKVLPFWAAVTCNFSEFDKKSVSAGEQVVLNINGGGIGMLSAARPVYASQNFTMNKYFTENLFKKVNGKHYRIGDVIAIAKNSLGSEINKLSYIYLGDPAVKLAFPTDYNITTTSLNNSTALVNDTVRAMSVVSVQGQVNDASNQKVNSFNGEVFVNVYDKAQRITTQNNQGDGGMTYTDRPNVLFSGNASVVDGVFGFTFMLPKDIKYNYGGGKMNFYAHSEELKADAQGHFENFIVGGTNKGIVYETDGPEIDLYLNTMNFVSGNAVNESPLLMAQIKDQNGINKVGSGIGHDLLVTVDNDPAQSKILNEFFETKTNSYSEGSLQYKLSNLSEGKHTLTFKAWDLLNNSTSKTIDFEVINGLQPVIFKVYNFPNPVKTTTNIVVEHDRPETILNTVIEIFDLAGRKIWQFEQSNADKVQWDLRGADGVKVNSGIYFYKVSISTNNSEVYSKTNKMFVLSQ